MNLISNTNIGYNIEIRTDRSGKTYRDIDMFDMMNPGYNVINIDYMGKTNREKDEIREAFIKTVEDNKYYWVETDKSSGQVKIIAVYHPRRPAGKFGGFDVLVATINNNKTCVINRQRGTSYVNFNYGLIMGRMHESSNENSKIKHSDRIIFSAHLFNSSIRPEVKESGTIELPCTVIHENGSVQEINMRIKIKETTDSNGTPVRDIQLKAASGRGYTEQFRFRFERQIKLIPQR